MGAAADSCSSAMGRIEAMGRAYIEFGLSRGEQYEVMLLGKHPASLSADDMRDMPGPQALTMVAAAVTEGIASGELRPDLDPMATAITLWATTHGAVMVLLDKRKNGFPLYEDEHAVIEHIIAMVRNGLRGVSAANSLRCRRT